MKKIFIGLVIFLTAALILMTACQPIVPTTECAEDYECVPEQCCHATDCIPSSQKQVCTELCTNLCVPGTIDCGGYCSCNTGQCTAHYAISITQTSCAQDSDCACGKNIATGECFYGNKDYVNVSQQCPDFCTGIAGNLEIKCVDNKCVQQVKAECTTDSDCIPAECCHATDCKPGTEVPECAAVLCSAICMPGTIDCGGGCACENGKCVAELNDL